MTIASSLQAVFGAAFAALYDDGVWHRVIAADDGQGGFSTTTADLPVKVLVDSLSEVERAAGGLPRGAVRLTVLRAGLGAAVAIDDGLATGGASFRVTQVDTDPAGAAYTLVAVPE
jgi:hypothetical protein